MIIPKLILEDVEDEENGTILNEIELDDSQYYLFLSILNENSNYAEKLFNKLGYNKDIDNEEKIVYVNKFGVRIEFDKEYKTCNSSIMNFAGESYHSLDLDLLILQAIELQLRELNEK